MVGQHSGEIYAIDSARGNKLLDIFESSRMELIGRSSVKVGNDSIPMASRQLEWNPGTVEAEQAMSDFESPIRPPSASNPPGNGNGCNGKSSGTSDGKSPPRYHRIQTVRLQQGISLRTAARHLGSNVREIRHQEDEASDLRLSDLYRWQEALDVPVEELLVDGERPLSRPVMERARFVRLMKTAMAIMERSPTPQIRRLAQMMIEQLTEVMPELEGIGAWHSVGQRRSLDEFGRIAERQISDDFVQPPPVDITD